MRRTPDIEDALRLQAEHDGFNATASTLPSNMDALPLVTFVRTGGSESSRVSELHSVSIDVRSSTWSDSWDAASRLTEWVRSLEVTGIDGMTCYTAHVTSLPYSNPDTQHPTLPRVTMAAQLHVRMLETN